MKRIKCYKTTDGKIYESKHIARLEQRFINNEKEIFDTARYLHDVFDYEELYKRLESFISYKEHDKFKSNVKGKTWEIMLKMVRQAVTEGKIDVR